MILLLVCTAAYGIPTDVQFLLVDIFLQQANVGVILARFVSGILRIYDWFHTESGGSSDQERQALRRCAIFLL